MRRVFFALGCMFVALGCAAGQDNPTKVHDLRVVGMRLEPPEVLIPGCNFQLLRQVVASALDGGAGDGGMGVPDGGAAVIDPRLLAVIAGQPLEFTALIADPQGAGRMLDYRLVACANRGDRTCTNEGDFVELEHGQTGPGELTVQLQGEKTLGIQKLNDGSDTLLLMAVLNQDTFKGLGGIRVPLMLELSASDSGERIFAQKLMVYTCPIDTSVQANVTPVLPGLRWAGAPWPADPVKVVSGRNPVQLEPEDFSAYEEPYVMPSFTLEPVSLTESWKINWLTTMGSMSAYQTGGVDFTGEENRNFSRWTPDPSVNEPQDVHFYMVVRDGRGGSSWLQRTVRWSP